MIVCMLKRVNFSNSDKVLDLGCGYGVIGIWISQFVDQNNVYMSDESVVAVKMAIRNAKVYQSPKNVCIPGAFFAFKCYNYKQTIKATTIISIPHTVVITCFCFLLIYCVNFSRSI